MILTVWCIFISFFSILFIGLPFSKLLLDNTKYEENDLFILAPFIGIGIIVLFLQNLIYLHFPIKHIFFILYLIAGMLWIWLFFNKKLKNFAECVSIKLILLLCLVYIIQAAGLFIVGAKYYVGRG